MTKPTKPTKPTNFANKTYPYFGKSANEDGILIVFFTGPNTGYMFGGNDPGYKLFEYHKTWKEWVFEKMEISEINLQEKVSTTIQHSVKI